MDNVTEEEFMSMSDEERVNYMGNEIGNSQYAEIERIQYNAHFENQLLREMNLKAKEYVLDKEESSEMFQQMIPNDWLLENIAVDTNSGRDMLVTFIDSYYEDIKHVNTLLWKVFMNVDMDSILEEYKLMNLDELLCTFVDMGKYHVIENSFHKDFNADNNLIQRMVLVAKLHDLEQIFHTMYRVGKIIKTIERNKKS